MQYPDRKEMAAPATAVLLAAAFLFAAVRHKLLHHLWLSAASLALSAAIYRTQLDFEPGMVFLLLALGALSAPIEIVRLRAYLRQNPVPQEGEL